MYELGQTISEGTDDLAERFGCENVHVSHHEDKVTFQLSWDASDTEMTELLEQAEDVLENKLPPENEPDNVTVSGFDDSFSVSIGYDYDAEDEDETNNEDTEKGEEE